MRMVKDIVRNSISQSIIRVKVQQGCLYLNLISGSSEFVR